MNSFAIALMYVAFFGLIGSAIYFTGSAMPLWALLLTPSLDLKNKKDKQNDD